MYELDDMVYAGNPEREKTVVEVSPYGGYRILALFSNGEQVMCDISPLLECPAFAPLRDKAVFDAVTVEYGAPSWCGGEVDISPAWVYQNGTVSKQIS